jgi:hypothetical protein
VSPGARHDAGMRGQPSIVPPPARGRGARASAMSQASPSPGGRAADPQPRAPDLARELAGDLPCIGCGYNLKALSIRALCPECATPVRATILAKVDPYAEVLLPLSRPRLTVLGLLLLTFGGASAAALTWGLRVIDAFNAASDAHLASHRIALAATAALILASAGAMLLLRPHDRFPVGLMLATAAGSLALLLVAAIHWQITVRFDPLHAAPYLSLTRVLPERSLLRLALSLTVIAVVLLLRPILRLLASRSLSIRMGRVDRQTLYVLASAAAIGLVGDLLHLAASGSAPSMRDPLILAGTLVIALSSVLLTVGLIGLCIDAARLAPVLLRPPLSLRQVLGEPAPEPRP